MKIREKLLLGFGITITITLIIAIMAYVKIRNVNTSYNNILDGAVTRSISLLNIRVNFESYRRLGAQTVIYSGDTDTITNIYNEYVRLKADTDAHFENFSTSLITDRSLNENERQSRMTMISELRDVLSNDYDMVINSIFTDAKEGNETDALNGIIENAKIANEVTELLESALASARSMRIDTAAETSESAFFAEIIIVALSVAGILITIVCAMLISKTISSGIMTITHAAQKIAKGDFGISVGSNGRDEIADMSNALLLLKDTIKLLVHDIKDTSNKYVKGDIDAKLDESCFNGEFKEVATVFNDTLAEFNDDLLDALDTVVNIGDGNFDIPVKQLPGKKAPLTASFEGVLKNLTKFSSDIQAVIDGAADGNLEISIDATPYKGGWGIMAKEINALIATIVMPVRESIEVMNQLSGGNLNTSVKGEYKGEFALMKSALNGTLTMLSSYIKEISETLTALADDDFDRSVEREYIGQFSEIKTALNTIINKFNRMIADIVNAAGNVAGGSEQIAQSSASLAQGASEQNATVAELKKTVSVIIETTHQNANDAKTADKLSKDSQKHAANGDRYMNDLLGAMNEIKESSNKISKIIKAIDDIAFQTNLLALNASVEAARAGEYGKGFAVVAEEVRNLAGKSQESARETAVLIEESISRVDNGTLVANQTADALHTIVDSIGNIADIITNIALSSDSQAEAIERIADGTAQISVVVQSNSAESEETAASAEELSGQAEFLKNLVSVFKLKNALNQF